MSRRRAPAASAWPRRFERTREFVAWLQAWSVFLLQRCPDPLPPASVFSGLSGCSRDEFVRAVWPAVCALPASPWPEVERVHRVMGDLWAALLAFFPPEQLASLGFAAPRFPGLSF